MENTQEGRIKMLNFIIYDDEKQFLQRNKQIIDNCMMNYDYDYKCHSFDEYNDKFESIIKSNNGLKIYLPDIEAKNKSGLDIVRLIREKYNDWSSIIIMITSHEELKYDALSNRLYLMDFINKLENVEEILKEDIKRIVESYTNSSESIVYEFNHNLKRIDYKNIIYISKEKDSKKCIIHTVYGNYPIGGTICDVLNKLNDKFIKISRSTIINVNQVSEYDIANNEILFLNGEKTTDISRLCKKDVIKRVCKLFK